MPAPVAPPNNVPQLDLQDTQPVYSNLARIIHTATDFFFDFAMLMPGQNSAKVVSRLILSPVGAKLLFRALAENLARYEATYGEIHLPQENSLANNLFRNIQPPDNKNGS